MSVVVDWRHRAVMSSPIHATRHRNATPHFRTNQTSGRQMGYIPSALGDYHLGADLVEVLPHVLVLQAHLDARQHRRCEWRHMQQARLCGVQRTVMVAGTRKHGHAVLLVLREELVHWQWWS